MKENYVKDKVIMLGSCQLSIFLQNPASVDQDISLIHASEKLAAYKRDQDESSNRFQGIKLGNGIYG